MEIVGITREINGKPEDLFVAYCPTHNYFYKGRPPITHGCRECWTVFYFYQCAQSKDFAGAVNQLDEALNHMQEDIEKGKWDFKPMLQPEFEYSKEEDIN